MQEFINRNRQEESCLHARIYNNILVVSHVSVGVPYVNIYNLKYTIYNLQHLQLYKVVDVVLPVVELM